MKKNNASQCGLFNPRIFVAFALCAGGALMGMLSLAATPPSGIAGKSSGGALLVEKPAAPISSIISATPGWAMVNAASPSTVQNNLFSDVACTSASDCWGVGSYVEGGVVHTLTERWNGTSWVLHYPYYINTDAYLKGVTCTSASNCWAVGYVYDDSGEESNAVLVERWDGNSWTGVFAPNPSNSTHNFLYDVTCASASDCWAVGEYSPNGSDPQTLIEHWNGTSWIIVSSPNSNALTNRLTSVTCASATQCWAVGYYYNASGYKQTLIEQWNGTSWAIVTSPNSAATQQNELDAVTCTSTSDCWAVGFYYNSASVQQTLIERWNGSSWAIVASANASATQHNALSGVTCASASDCWAVGAYSNPGQQTLIERWNGTAWAIVSSPNVGSQPNFLDGVACVSGTDCWALGFYFSASIPRTLAQHWNGTSWANVSSPNADFMPYSVAFDVTCPSSSDCWAVGFYSDAGLFKTLIERWNGSAWTVVTSPNVTGTDNYLQAVSCPSSSDCWAVGYYSGTSAFQTLIQHWNGSSWAIVTSPNSSNTQDNFLSDLACTSTTDCWAVGSYTGGSGYPRTLIEHWNGTSWSVVASPNSTSPYDNVLSGVTCLSTSQCWAVGYHYDNPGNYLQTLIEQWNGSSWAIVPSPNLSDLGDYPRDDKLNAVTCVSSSDCWAVGSDHSNYDYQDRALIQRWNGSAWVVVSLPNINPGTETLSEVTCASSSDCWTIGTYLDANDGQTLIEHWDGHSWNLVSSPNPGSTQSDYLYGLTCTSASDCWAVGSYSPQTTAQPLALHYTPNTPALTPSGAVSRRTHGANAFDIDLPIAGNLGIECRKGGGFNGYDFLIVTTFPSPVTVTGASLASGYGSSQVEPPSAGPAQTVMANLHHYDNYSDPQRITLRLNVTDGSNSAHVAVPIGIVLGDTSGNGSVNASDVSQTKSKSGQAVDATNFRTDVTVSNSINSSDVSLVKSKSGTALP